MRTEPPRERAGEVRRGLPRLLLALCASALLLVSCEFTLFPEGIPAPQPTPTPGGEECANPFPGLRAYETGRETAVDITLLLPAAVAVVPRGMGFGFTPQGGTGRATAEPGDLFAADLATNRITFYHQRGGNVPVVFPSGARELGGGVALYYEEVAVAGGTQKVQLLLYTGTSRTTGKSNLFLHDLNENSSLSPNPFRIPDDAQGVLPGVTDLQAAHAVAAGRSGDTRGVLVADMGAQPNDQSVYRISLRLLNSLPVPESMARVAGGFRGIQDVAFSGQTRALYLVEMDASPINNSTVYRIAAALSTPATAVKSSLTPFVPASQLETSTGITLAPTSKTGAAQDLLVLSREVRRALGRFDASQGGFALEYLRLQNVENRQAVAYDCIHGRILFTRKDFSPGLFALTR